MLPDHSDNPPTHRADPGGSVQQLPGLAQVPRDPCRGSAQGGLHGRLSHGGWGLDVCICVCMYTYKVGDMFMLEGYTCGERTTPVHPSYHPTHAHRPPSHVHTHQLTNTVGRAAGPVRAGGGEGALRLRAGQDAGGGA